ncbi:zinc finger and BTB domain-containing protein 1 [Zootoca vivipara]|uniref:zinc finger and BTB domain-containing protein 1 n=1 Tax=Zootoca vivipara TaxID=8524 RepID=UPI00293BC199|nr:zinc finger and BTB domain-containing protein 1 [Zootoca vivipara]XP_034960476.2 zinc finger and BTB domain-containing protein 1 [Zootoca vivipara]XP_060127447.1 zinc finger and BTB domain-containing protein 1 [Zootoca vivipara]XP_060127449.1 zinc finger and BTB domain-containing protein 1 [Zootoca vivipara]
MARTSHSSYVLQQLNNQREWGFLCDCCIAIDDIYFQAHKAVLAACSSYFRMFFMSQQHSTAQLNLSNMKITAECFDLILQFMYLGKIATAPNNFEQFKVAMNSLQLYNVPECLEDIQDTNSSGLGCSSSASSTQNSKMVFGVRMYEETLARSGSETSRCVAEPPSSTVSTSQSREVSDEALQLSSLSEQPLEICKGSAARKAKDRVSISRRFGRSFTCDGCGFSFSCERLLDEHIMSCTNRHSYQNARYYGADKKDGGERDPALKTPSPQLDKFKAEASQATDGSSSPASNVTSGKGSTVSLEALGKQRSRAMERKRIIVKVEPEDNPIDDMKEFNIIKVTDGNDSTDNDELDDDDPVYRYYIEEEVSENRRVRKAFLKPHMPIDEEARKYFRSARVLSSKVSAVEEGPENASCELCGQTITEEDLSSHYLSKHIENICACGKCGQILVKGRQLQDHAQSCGEPQDLTTNGLRNMEEKIDLEESPEEQSEIQEMMYVEMLDEFGDGHFQMNSLPKKQLYRDSACPFRCPNCGLRFETENLVVEHMSSCLDQDLFKNAMMEENERDHRRKHFCNLCGKGFYQRCHLREHYTVHTKEKQFACQTCGKQFLRERQLRLHNDMHKGMARYVCSICDQGNFRKHDHVRHMISHLSAGETICQVCFQIFPNNEQLEQHMDVHLYTCGVCGAKFNLRKDMRSHYNAKHLKRT